ncbi:uncharacterized protein A1O9_02815 [Exophiala aquamarina CBS 119918]|uniref:MARVEL domain-containing protein n=1 Tax=Exophiala aquamarina CBS 119918 TaxID=1182545 RepID=A0A072Q032_9EURO|nr:uncharacterized protein A1O9_02815 [Exophiala aquamarina CBS 119918]KEF61250.1 hypothetical protein A1O9_02815 [Exophiala aquamarina CBS 119918]
MRLTAVLTLACAIATLVLSLLSLLAGSSRSFLQDSDMMTLNISRIGHTSLFNTTDGDGGFFDDLVNDLQEDINDLINDASSDIAEALNLPDFLSVHVMDFCQGTYSPNSTVRNPSMNTTECSNRTTLFHFRPTKIVEDALPDGITLEDIHWPSEIQDAERAIRIASNAMVVCYIIGIVFAGLAIFTAIWAIFSSGRLSALINFVIDMLAFLSLGIASAIATAIIVKATNAINKYGDDIGIAAYRGGRFLGMTWAATALMLLASVVSIVQCCGGRRKERRYGGKSQI